MTLRGYGGILGTPPRVTIVTVSDSEKAWMADGACRNAPDVDLWFPSPGESHETAKAVCRDCPVRRECLAYALRHNERFGIWGGLNERERRQMRRAQGLPRGGGTQSMFTAIQRARMVWLDKQGWTDGEIGTEFGCTARTVQRILDRERHQ